MRVQKQTKKGDWDTLASGSSIKVLRKTDTYVLLEFESYSTKGDSELFRISMTRNELTFIQNKPEI